MQKERDAVDSGKLGLEAADYVGGVDFALGERLEVDLDAAAVEGGIRAVDADEGRKTLDRRVFEDDIGKSLLALRHGDERNILRAFGNAEDDAGILDGKESFGNVDVEEDRADESGDGDEKCGGAIAQDKLQGSAVESNDGIEGILGLAIKPAFIFLFLMPKEFGAHHGSER